MFCRLTKVAAWLFVSATVFTISASAEPITYQWKGNNGFTGFFTLDRTAFTTIEPEAEVSQSKLTAFLFSGPGFTFDLSEVNLASAIFFDTTVNPAAYLAGGGVAATDPAHNQLIFFASEIRYLPVGKEPVISSGEFAVTTTPEPAYGLVMIVGFVGCFAARRRLLAKDSFKSPVA